MTRRSTNSHDLKVREHPFRVELPDDVARQHGDAIHDAAARLSSGVFYTWAPSRPYPPINVYAFTTEAARDAFAAWAAEHVPG